MHICRLFGQFFHPIDESSLEVAIWNGLYTFINICLYSFLYLDKTNYSIHLFHVVALIRYVSRLS